MERRSGKRAPIRLACSLELGAGAAFSGYTQNLSTDGAQMESHDLCAPGRNPPKPGDMGVFTLSFRKGPFVDAIKITARVVYIMGGSAGLTLLTGELTQAQRENLTKILETRSEKID
jgi:hypothetical protein